MPVRAASNKCLTECAIASTCLFFTGNKERPNVCPVFVDESFWITPKDPEKDTDGEKNMDAMTADQTIEHLENMGVLNEYITTNKGDVVVILASAPEAYAFRCMKDFSDAPGFYKARTGIDGVTSDGAKVIMTILD